MSRIKIKSLKKSWRDKRNDKCYTDWEIILEEDNITAQLTTHYHCGTELHYAYVMSKDGDEFVQREVHQHTLVWHEDVVDDKMGRKTVGKIRQWFNQARNHTKDVCTAIVGVQLLFQYKHPVRLLSIRGPLPGWNNLIAWRLNDVEKFINNKRGKGKTT